MWHVYVDTNVEHSCRTLQNSLKLVMSYQQEIVWGYFFIGAPCTVCSGAMLIMQLLDVWVVLECNVFVFLILLLNIIFTYANEFSFLPFVCWKISHCTLDVWTACLLLLLFVLGFLSVHALSEIIFTKFIYCSFTVRCVTGRASGL